MTIKHNPRVLDLYQSGLSDYEIAAELGVSPSGIRYWRSQRGLSSQHSVNKVPMEQVLDPDQCEAMRRFLGCLVTFSDRFPGKKIDILMFAREYRKGVGEVS